MHPDLTPERIDELKEDLLGELRSLTRRVRAIRESGPVMLDQTAVGRLSRMDALMNQGIAQGSDARTVQALSLVEDALARIEAGTYGFCQTCTHPIPYDRLAVLPETRTCAGCGRSNAQ